MGSLGFMRKAAKMMLQPPFSSSSSSSAGFRFLGRTEKYVSFSSSTNYTVSEVEPQSLSSPLLLLHDKTEYIKYTKGTCFWFYSPAENKVVHFMKQGLPEWISTSLCCGSSKGWLGFLNKNGDCAVSLVDLFSSSTSAQIIPLPKNDSFNFSANQFENYFRRVSLHKKIAMSSFPNEKDCTVMSISHEDVIRFAIGDSNWTELEDKLSSYNVDIMYSENRKTFYVLNAIGHINQLRLNGVDRNRDRKHLEYGSSGAPRGAFVDGRYLVESLEKDVLVVERFLLENKTVWFNVWKVNFEKMIAQPVDSLGDNILFLGGNESFSVSASDYLALRPNSIYFVYDCQRSPLCDSSGSPYWDHNSGVYSLEDHRISTPLFDPLKFRDDCHPAIVWVLPKPERNLHVEGIDENQMNDVLFIIHKIL